MVWFLQSNLQFDSKPFVVLLSLLPSSVSPWSFEKAGPLFVCFEDTFILDFALALIFNQTGPPGQGYRKWGPLHIHSLCQPELLPKPIILSASLSVRQISAIADDPDAQRDDPPVENSASRPGIASLPRTLPPECTSSRPRPLRRPRWILQLRSSPW